MNVGRISVVVLALLAVDVAIPRAALAAVTDEFYKACYLQTEQRDFAAAAELFAAVAEHGEATPEMRQAAERRLMECREELASADLAGLMPPDAILYVQLGNVGAQVKTLLESLGVAGDTGRSAATSSRIPIEPGLSIPTDIGLSPALVREISKLGGVAVAVTGFDSRGVPEGVGVVHLGGSDLVRGLVETSLQIVTPSEAVGDYATYRIPVEGDELWLVQTERLLVFSGSRDEAAAAIGRLEGDGGVESLSSNEAFRNAAGARGDSLLFAWADSQRAAPLVDALMAEEMRGEELIAARTALNLQQIECATFSLGATEGGLRGQAAVRFTPGHQHLIYGLIRTAPIGEDALRHVPATAGAVAAVGLNPPVVAAQASGDRTPHLALMDIGRELFANMRSVSAFVMPGDGPIPELGLVVYAQDGSKSEALWSRLMAVPAQLGVIPANAVQDTEIQGHAATRYAYPDAPPIFVTQPSAESLVVGTAGAVEASLAALENGLSLAAHADGVRLCERVTPATCKALLLRAGPLLRCAAPSLSEQERRQLAAVAPILDELTASFAIDEEENELRVRVDVTGIPQVGDVLRAVSGQPSEPPPGGPQAAVR
jgi:hypothetical protein